jgi:hypothetical protein
MKLTIVVLVALLGWQARLSFQEPSVPSTVDSENSGMLADGKYLNEVMGLRLELPTDWKIVPTNNSERPQHVVLCFSSQFDQMVLAGTAVAPDEILSEVFHWELEGTIDGGEFKTVGKQIRESRDGHEVFTQKLDRRVSSGRETAFYVGFFNRGYYVSILLFGPPNTEGNRAAIIKSLNILSDAAK